MYKTYNFDRKTITLKRISRVDDVMSLLTTSVCFPGSKMSYEVIEDLVVLFKVNKFVKCII